ncbi:MAG: ribosome small subunit-dependent GTPase A [Acidimicrobiales bacterium]|nr:ribosome small subunit-dependent GTPase A [Acidimicrobiales bacterium]
MTPEHRPNNSETTESTDASSPPGVGIRSHSVHDKAPTTSAHQIDADGHAHAVGLASLGWNDRVAALLAEHDGEGEPARVVRVDNTHLYVNTGSRSLQIPLALLPRRWRDAASGRPTTGDWLLVDTANEPATIDSVLPRWSLLARSDALGRSEQLLAANVDVVLIVQGLDRPLKPGRIERSMALAWEAGATPVIVLTKADLDPTSKHAKRATADLATIAPNVEVIVTSSVTGSGLDSLRRLIAPGITAALVGESGAGKSTLVNALVGAPVQATADVREGDAKGRHTTTARDLIPLPGGGVVIDTPGLRSLGLWDTHEGVASVFADLEELADRCRFPDCEHRTEPGCAILAAVEASTVDPARVERWLRYIDELEEAEQRRAARGHLEQHEHRGVTPQASTRPRGSSRRPGGPGPRSRRGSGRRRS